MSTLSKLESRIGYIFVDNSLLEQAVTHRSYSDKNNERLEFLGDSILNFSVAAAVFDLFPQAPEGDLSRLRARLVRQATLAEIARQLDLGSFLQMGSGERKSGGFERDSILSDALEAVIGAVYLDSEIRTALDCVQGLFKGHLDSLTEADIAKDSKTRLQELLQSQGEPLPEYKLIATKGKSPHQEFEVECQATTLEQAVRARGRSRRRAEQSAAKLALQKLKGEQ